MRILVACEESQVVCKAFREKGHEAYSCDIQECSGGHPEWHIQGDVLKVLNPRHEKLLTTGTPTGVPQKECVVKEWQGITFRTMDGKWHIIDGKWDLIIAHPPCTYMSKAGARWMFAGGVINQDRLEKAMEAKQFFLEIWNCDCEKVIIENPTPLKIVGLPVPTQVIQPYKFDPEGQHPYSKRTCLWERGVEPLKETTPNAKPIATWMPSNTGGFSRGQGGGRGIAHDQKTASRTFSGVGNAMAEQWG